MNIAIIHPDLGIGIFQVTVYGSFLPRHIFYRLHAVCAYLRCLFVALCVLLGMVFLRCGTCRRGFSRCPIAKLKRSSKVLLSAFHCSGGYGERLKEKCRLT